MHCSFGLGVSSLDHRRREEFPAISDYTGEMKKLNIFIDESGDFGEARERPAYYLVTFVFHNRADNIDDQVKKLEDSIRISEFNVEYIHTGPVIRREDVFARYSIDERRKLLYKMLNFVNACPISYLTVAIDRKEAIKSNEKRLSKSEKQFFYKPKELKKTFLKSVEKKRLQKSFRSRKKLLNHRENYFFTVF